MLPRRPAFIFLILVLFSPGCLSIDVTPLRDQGPYLKTKKSLDDVHVLVSQDSPSHSLMLGVTRVDITPPVGTPLAGYGSRKGRGSTGIHDRLYARAVALSDGDQTVILLANDLLAITDDIRTAVYQKINREISLKPDSIMISASHTHSGPGALAKRFWESFATGPFEQSVFEEITQKMARAAVEAYQGMKPARLGSGSVQVPDLISNRMVVDGPRDPDLSFLVIKTVDPGVTAYVANYSAHPTVLKDNNDLISGDFPGALERHLEETPGVIALYTAGSVADMTANPPEGTDDFEKADKMGRALANKILEALPSVVYRDHARIGSVLATVQLPSTQVKLGRHRLASSLGNLFFDRQTVIQAIRVGDSLLLGVPCDLSSEIGLEIKQQARSHGLNAIVVGFANDYIGYVIPEKYYYTNAYEARMSFNGPYMDRYLKEISLELIKKLISAGRKGENG